MPLGGKFTCRSLEDGSIQELEYKPMKIVELKSVTDIKNLKTGEYGKPNSKIFEAGDAVEQNDRIYQMTTDLTHGIKVNGFRDIAHQLKSATVYFIFVVPKDVYPHYKKQTISGVTAAIKSPKHEQWVMNFDYQSLITSSSSSSSPSASTPLMTIASMPESEILKLSDTIIDNMNKSEVEVTAHTYITIVVINYDYHYSIAILFCVCVSIINRYWSKG